jgi:hypothetical protein
MSLADEGPFPFLGRELARADSIVRPDCRNSGLVAFKRGIERPRTGEFRMAARPRKRLREEQRRALRLLASIPFGTSETIMLAQGFNRKTLASLVRAGLATAQRKAVRITDAGRSALED